MKKKRLSWRKRIIMFPFAEKTMKRINLPFSAAAILCISSCVGSTSLPESYERPALEVGSADVARILSALDLGAGQFAEVHDAVSSSSGNGYDEEYTMKDLFTTPGAGVGDTGTKASPREYDRPLRDLFAEYLSKATKASGDASDGQYITDLTESDIQIYWPFSESWDGHTAPVITFDPGDGSETNIGYRTSVSPSGERVVEEVTVTEEMSRRTPVWVVNRNTDAGFKTLEMLRRENPDWGAGGDIVIGTKASGADSGDSPTLKTLILREFVSNRNYDTWFAGASEFFVKVGAVEDFYASTEAEMKLYNPSVTDFVVVVRRNQVGVPIPFNAVLVSQWSEQLTSCAFMITEDDGGTRTSWKCTAEVKIQSKTSGFNIEIPFKTNDDIVWRGQLSRQYLEKYSGRQGHFGDVDITFEIVEM